MSTTTTNYGLIKPDTTDPILIGQLNDNMDTIDTVLKDHSDKIDAAALGIKYKGEVNYYADLPNNAEIGDAYTVKYAGSSGTTPDGTEYVWGAVSGVNQWINFSKDSYSKAEVDALLALKQNVLNSAQLAAVNSGIDSAKVAQIATNETNISKNEKALKNCINSGLKNFLPKATSITGELVTKTTIASDGIVTITLNEPLSAEGSVKWEFPLNAGTYKFSSGENSSLSGTYDCFISDTSTTPPTTVLRDHSIAPGQTATISSGNYRCTIRIRANAPAGIYVFKPFLANPDTLTVDSSYQPYAMSNAELTAAIQAIQAQLANQ